MTMFNFEAKNVEFRAPVDAISEAVGYPVTLEEFAAFPVSHIMELIDRTERELHGSVFDDEGCHVQVIANQGSCPKAEPGIDGRMYFTEHLSSVNGLYNNGCSCAQADEEDERAVAFGLMDVYLQPSYDIPSDTYFNIELAPKVSMFKPDVHDLSGAEEISEAEARSIIMGSGDWKGRTMCISPTLAIIMEEWEGYGDEEELEEWPYWAYYTLISRVDGSEFDSGAFGYDLEQTLDQWLHEALYESELEHLYEC